MMQSYFFWFLSMLASFNQHLKYDTIKLLKTCKNVIYIFHTESQIKTKIFGKFNFPLMS